MSVKKRRVTIHEIYCDICGEGPLMSSHSIVTYATKTTPAKRWDACNVHQNELHEAANRHIKGLLK